ncbi:MAG: VTT domain-containing protein [Patescibacteria group bacterium]
MTLEKKAKIKQGFVSAAAPLIYLGLFLLLSLVWWAFSMPEPQYVFNYILNLFDTHGLMIVGLAAFIEGLVLINIYFPGSAVIVIGVIAEKGDAKGAALVVLTTTIAFILSGVVNYFIGYYGLHSIIKKFGGETWLKQAEAWYQRSGNKAILASYMHPNLGAFISVACGNARYNFARFLQYAATASICWNILWGIIVFNFATMMGRAVTQGWPVIVLLLTWAIVVFIKGYRETPKGTAETSALI